MWIGTGAPSAKDKGPTLLKYKVVGQIYLTRIHVMGGCQTLGMWITTGTNRLHPLSGTVMVRLPTIDGWFRLDFATPFPFVEDEKDGTCKPNDGHYD